MSEFYVYPLNIDDFHAFERAFPDLNRRNEGFRVVNTRHYGWLDPPDFENRRRIVLTPEENEVIVLAKTGRDDWDFVRWLARNEIPMAPPIQMYLW